MGEIVTDIFPLLYGYCQYADALQLASTYLGTHFVTFSRWLPYVQDSVALHKLTSKWLVTQSHATLSALSMYLKC